jgi:hypothetical protein
METELKHVLMTYSDHEAVDDRKGWVAGQGHLQGIEDKARTDRHRTMRPTFAHPPLTSASLVVASTTRQSGVSRSTFMGAVLGGRLGLR